MSDSESNTEGGMDLQEMGEISKCMTSGAERKDLAREVIGTKCSWERFLFPAPKSVAILGQLMALGTIKDFSLKENEPIGGFKYIKHPNSFRACLVQLATDGARSFSNSHTSMDKIKLYAMQFQVVMKDTVQLLLRECSQNHNLIAKRLEDLQTYTTKCYEISNETETQFSSLTNLLSELQMSSTEAQGLHETKIKEAEVQRQIIEMKKKDNEKKKLDTEESNKVFTHQIAEAKSILDKTIEEIPGPWKSVAIATFEKLVSTASAIGTVMAVGTLSNPIGLTVVGGYTAVKAVGLLKEEKGKLQKEEDVQTVMAERQTIILALNQAPAISTATKYLSTFVENLKSKKSNSEKDELCEVWIKEIKDVIDIFNGVIVKFDALNVPTATHHEIVSSALEICTNGVSLCEDLLKNRGQMSAGMEKKIESIKTKATCLELQSNHLLAPGAMYNSADEVQMTTKGEKRKVQKAAEGVYTKLEMRKQELDYLRQEEKRNQTKAEQIEKEQIKILEDLAKINIQEVDFVQIVDMLSQCMEAFGKLQEQWQTLTMLFSHITNRIKICLIENTEFFTANIEHCNTDITLYSAKIMLQSAATANAVAHATQLIAQIYTEISEKYLVGPTAGLTQMIGLDPKKDKDQIEKKRKMLLDLAEKAQKEIKHLSQNAREKQLKSIDDQFNRISALGEKVPQLPIEIKMNIRKDVLKSLQPLTTKETADDYI